MKSRTLVDVGWQMVTSVTLDILDDGAQGVTRLVGQIKDEGWELGDDVTYEDLEALAGRVRKGADLARSFLDSFGSKPFSKLLKNEPLTEQEYYALRALDVLPNFSELCGVTDQTEYKVFRFLRYDGGDDGPTGIIIPSVFAASCPGHDGAPVTLSTVDPVQVRRSRLFPRQLDFFRKRFAWDFTRMQP